MMGQAKDASSSHPVKSMHTHLALLRAESGLTLSTREQALRDNRSYSSRLFLEKSAFARSRERTLRTRVVSCKLTFLLDGSLNHLETLSRLVLERGSYRLPFRWS